MKIWGLNPDCARQAPYISGPSNAILKIENIYFYFSGCVILDDYGTFKNVLVKSKEAINPLRRQYFNLDMP